MSIKALQKEGHSGKAETSASRVLVVDDQPICLSILSRLIEAQGLLVESAQDGQQALSMWQEKHYSLIITDCNMPNMNGLSLTRAIRRIEQTDNLNKSTIVTLSSNNNDGEAQQCIDAGTDHIMSKPINAAQLEVILSIWKKTTSENKETQNTNSSHLINHQTPINYTVLTELFPDTIKHAAILKKLQTHIQADYQTLQLEIELANFLEIERLAHRMNGACKMVGANDIATACEEIETSAKKGLPVKEASISTLNQRINEFDAYLNEQIQPSPDNQIETN